MSVCVRELTVQPDKHPLRCLESGARNAVLHYFKRHRESEDQAEVSRSTEIFWLTAVREYLNKECEAAEVRASNNKLEINSGRECPLSRDIKADVIKTTTVQEDEARKWLAFSDFR